MTYNPAGQIVTATRDNDLYARTGAVDVERPYAVSGLNQYISAGAVAITHDANGNLTADGAQTYAYDVENRVAGSGDTIRNSCTQSASGDCALSG